MEGSANAVGPVDWPNHAADLVEFDYLHKYSMEPSQPMSDHHFFDFSRPLHLADHNVIPQYCGTYHGEESKK